MTVGGNSQQELRAYFERIERIRAEKKALGDDEAAIFAEAKASGFNATAMRVVLKRRKAKPHDLAEHDALVDLYLHAMGMATEPPLFRFAGLASVDNTARDAVIEGMKAYVPPHGEGHIDVKFGAGVIRLERQKDDTVTATEMAEIKRAPAVDPAMAQAAPREPVPDVDEDGAVELGVEYAHANRPVIDNPFPFGDPRRAKFDEGWRRGSGGDGMGPDEDD